LSAIGPDQYYDTPFRSYKLNTEFESQLSTGPYSKTEVKNILLNIFSNTRKDGDPHVVIWGYVGLGGKSWMVLAKLSNHSFANNLNTGWYCVDSSGNKIELPVGTYPAYPTASINEYSSGKVSCK